MKRIIYLTIIVISLIIIQNLAQSLSTLWHKQFLIVQVEKDLEKAKQENRMLREQLSAVQSQEFVERQARDKLLLVLPEEEQIIISKSLLKQKRTATLSAVVQAPVWQQWLNLFF